MPPDRNAQRTAQRGREVQAIIARMAAEIAACEAQLPEATEEAARARIETEILHLSLALSELRRGHYSGD
jgi:hypothetical protein